MSWTYKIKRRSNPLTKNKWEKYFNLLWKKNSMYSIVIRWVISIVWGSQNFHHQFLNDPRAIKKNLLLCKKKTMKRRTEERKKKTEEMIDFSLTLFKDFSTSGLRLFYQFPFMSDNHPKYIVHSIRIRILFSSTSEYRNNHFR